jgi:hypothetical protein
MLQKFNTQFLNDPILQKIVTMGGGDVKNYQKQRDVIYGRPQKVRSSFFF